MTEGNNLADWSHFSLITSLKWAPSAAWQPAVFPSSTHFTRIISPVSLSLVDNFTSHFTEKIWATRRICTNFYCHIYIFPHLCLLYLTFPSATINCYELFIFFLKPVSPLCTISHLPVPAQWHCFCTNFSSPLKNTNMMLFLQQKHKQLPLIPHLNQTTALFLFPFTTKFLKVIVFTYSLAFFFSVFSWTHHK